MIRRFFLFLCFASFSLFGATSLSAQPWWIDTINIPGYTYDPRFYIGVNAVGSAEDFIKVLYERVRGDYTYTYGGPRLPEMLVLRDSSLWNSDPAERFIDRGKARYWLDREDYPLKAMYGPDRVFKAGKITRSTENVYNAYSQDDVRHSVQPPRTTRGLPVSLNFCNLLACPYRTEHVTIEEECNDNRFPL